MIPSESPFFDIPRTEWIAANRSAFAVLDAFPVSPGHALVISRRQISDWWQATAEEKVDLFALVDEVRATILSQHAADGFNVGFNAGQAAGQTIDHLHIHVIPRYTGDIPDPRGGVRHVIPSRGNYLAQSAANDSDLSPSSAVLIDGQVRLLLPELVDHLRRATFDRVDIVVSFIKMSGLKHVLGALVDALDRGAQIRVLTTDYLGLTEPLALARLLDLMEDYPTQLSVKIFHDPQVSFHPKAYLFYSSTIDGPESAFVGSSNLSGSGLAGGIEWNLLVGSISELRRRFTLLWSDERCEPLSDRFILDYRPAPPHVPEDVEVADQPDEPPSPRPIQEEALEALARTRDAGFHAGMVTLATGLGKTWLAAFDVAETGTRRALFIAHREEILRQSRDVFRQTIPTATLGLYFGGEKQADADIVFASVQTLSRNLDRFAPDAFDYVVIDEFHHAAAVTYRAVLDHFVPQFLLGLTATPDRMDGADLLSLCADNLVFDCGLVEGIRRSELVPFRYWGVPDPVDFEPIPWRNGKFDPAALEAAIETQERAQAAFDEWQTHRGARTLAFCASQQHADFMSEYFQDRGIRSASVHSGPTSAPRNESIDALRDGDLDVVFAVDLFNEGLDVPTIDTVLMLRPTESPIIFLQQLGRGLRTVEGKSELTVVDFIGNHRSFLLKPRTLLSLSQRDAPTTLQVLQAMQEGDFGLPDGCSVDYELTVVDMLRTLARTTPRDAIEEYCRSYFEEEGLRPTAAQAFRAGHDPSAVVSRHGSWFAFLRAIDLLGDREAAAFEAHGDTLRAIQVESITKCYKLIAMRALLHDGTFCAGDDVSQNAATSRNLLLTDPRLSREVPSSQFPDLRGAPADKWSRYWLKWPIAHLTGAEGNSARTDFLFRLESDRIVPSFTIDTDIRGVFEAMAAELIEYRLARYVLNDEQTATRTWTCRLAFADGAPVIRLDRRKYPDLPSGTAEFIADGIKYEGTFSTGLLAFATREGVATNALPDMLRGWFGPSAGHPGTAHTVELDLADGTLTLRAVSSHSSGVEVEYVPLFGDYRSACDPVARQRSDTSFHTEIPVQHKQGRDLSRSNNFVCFADDHSVSADGTAIRHGEPLLFEWITGGSMSDYVDQPVILGAGGEAGSSKVALKVLRRRADGYLLEAGDPAAPSVEPRTDMLPAARLITTLNEDDLNPLAERIGEQFKSMDVPALYGEVYNPGNWRSGHVSLSEHAILFVTLEKRADRTQYIEHFEDTDLFVWSSQNSTKPEGKKGREILEAPQTGKSIEIWMRRNSSAPFTYVGRAVPLSHEGSQPMLVTFRLLTPLSGELQSRFAFDKHYGEQGDAASIRD